MICQQRCCLSFNISISHNSVGCIDAYILTLGENGTFQLPHLWHACMLWSLLGRAEDAVCWFKLCGCWEWRSESLGVVLWHVKQGGAMLWNNAMLNTSLSLVSLTVVCLVFFFYCFLSLQPTPLENWVLLWLLCYMLLMHMKAQRSKHNRTQ